MKGEHNLIVYTYYLFESKKDRLVTSQEKCMCMCNSRQQGRWKFPTRYVPMMRHASLAYNWAVNTMQISRFI